MFGQRFTYLAFRIVVETIDLFRSTPQTASKVFISYFNGLRGGNDNFSTGCPQKLWKIQKTCQTLVVVLLLLGSLLTLSACSSSKAFQAVRTPAGEAALMAKSEDEIKQAIGEPDVVSKTPENTVLWIYKPSWRIVPSPKDTVYVEFDKGKVVKVVKIK
jgi:hypothetical protein